MASALLYILSTSATAHVIRAKRHVDASTALTLHNTTLASYHRTLNASAFNLTSTDGEDDCDGYDATDGSDAGINSTISATDFPGINTAAVNATASNDDGEVCDTDDSSNTSVDAPTDPSASPSTTNSNSDSDDDNGCDEQDEGNASEPDSTPDAVISVTPVASIAASPSVGAVLDAAAISVSITQSSSFPANIAPSPTVTPAASPPEGDRDSESVSCRASVDRMTHLNY